MDATCDGTFEPTYEASVRVWDHGCEVTASSSATWCSSSETQCEDIELLLRIDGDTAAVTGTYRRCWCGGSPAGTQVDVSGTATRLSQ